MGNIKVLVVEDAIIIQKLLEFYFQKLHCNYSIAPNGLDALNILKTERFNLILMDLGLPDIDGITLTETLRKFHDLGDTPIIALTAHDDKKIKDFCLKNGMSDFITKPLDFEGLIALLQKHLPDWKPTV